MCASRAGVAQCVERVGYGLGSPGLSIPSRPALGTIRPTIQWVPVVVRGVSGRDLKLTTDLHLVPELRMSRVKPVHPYTRSWCGQGRL